MKNLKFIHGFTIIELMLTLLILGLLTALAAPMMDSTLKTQSVRALQKDFHSVLVYARSEAITRNRVISVCGSSDGATCSAAGWSDGWLVFVDNQPGLKYGDGVLDTGEALLRVSDYEGTAIAAVIDPDTGNPVSAITFSLRGFTYGSNRAYAQICPSDADDSFARGLMLERSGRVVHSRDSDADGIHDRIFEKDDGTAESVKLDC